LLHSLLSFEKNFTEAGIACWVQAYSQTSLNRRIQSLKESGAIFSQGRDSASFKAVSDEQIDLLDFQRALDIRYEPVGSFVGLTVIQTVSFISIHKSKIDSKFLLYRLENYIDVQQSNQQKPHAGSKKLLNLSRNLKSPKKLCTICESIFSRKHSSGQLLLALQRRKSPQSASSILLWLH
jgi:hypothetical protein